MQKEGAGKGNRMLKLAAAAPCTFAQLGHTPSAGKTRETIVEIIVRHLTNNGMEISLEEFWQINLELDCFFGSSLLSM